MKPQTLILCISLALFQGAHAQAIDESLMPIHLGTLSNGAEVVFNMSVATGKAYFPVVDWIAPVANYIGVETTQDDVRALNVLKSRPEFDRRFTDGTFLLRKQVANYSSEIVENLNNRLSSLFGLRAYSEMKGPFTITATLNINPYSGFGQCAQYWLTIFMKGSVDRLTAYSYTTISACDKEIPTQGSLQGQLRWENSLSQFVNEPFAFVQHGLADLKTTN